MASGVVLEGQASKPAARAGWGGALDRHDSVGISILGAGRLGTQRRSHSLAEVGRGMLGGGWGLVGRALSGGSGH
jgi:hypothetical protein